MPVAARLEWRLFGLLLCVIATGCDHTDEVTPRSYVSLLVSDTLPQRRIAQQLLAGQAISSAGALNVAPKEQGALVMPVDFGWVTAGGSIFTYSKKYGVAIVQEPTISNGAVKWSCIVHPADAKPNVCGNK